MLGHSSRVRSSAVSGRGLLKRRRTRTDLPWGRESAPAPHGTPRGRARRGLAYGTILGLMGSVLATVALARPAEADLHLTQPNLPTNQYQLVDLPAFPTSLVLSGGTVRSVSETDVGVQFDEFGPAAGEVFDTSKAMTSNEFTAPSAGTILSTAKDIVYGDIDADGSPEMYTLRDDNIVLVSRDLSAGLRYDDQTDQIAVGVAGHGTVVGFGIVDSLSDQRLNHIWAVTDQGWFTAAPFSGAGRVTSKLPLYPGERILDGTSNSRLDHDVLVTDGSQMDSGISILRTTPATATGGAPASKFTIDGVSLLDGLESQFINYTAGPEPTTTTPWVAGAGSVRRDRVVDGNNSRVSQAAFVTKQGDPRLGYLRADGYEGDYCPSADPSRVPRSTST